MNVLTLFRENEDARDTSEGREIGRFNDDTVLASYLASLPDNELWLYRVTVWFIGHDGDWPEEAWSFEDSFRADEWLTDFKECNDGPLYTVGSRVVLPVNARIRKGQKILCVIDSLHPELGREYAILKGITRRGVSQSSSQVVYWHLSRLHHLRLQ